MAGRSHLTITRWMPSPMVIGECSWSSRRPSVAAMVHQSTESCVTMTRQSPRPAEGKDDRRVIWEDGRAGLRVRAGHGRGAWRVEGLLEAELEKEAAWPPNAHDGG